MRWHAVRSVSTDTFEFFYKIVVFFCFGFCYLYFSHVSFILRLTFNIPLDIVQEVNELTK